MPCSRISFVCPNLDAPPFALSANFSGKMEKIRPETATPRSVATFTCPACGQLHRAVHLLSALELAPPDPLKAEKTKRAMAFQKALENYQKNDTRQTYKKMVQAHEQLEKISQSFFPSSVSTGGPHSGLPLQAQRRLDHILDHPSQEDEDEEQKPSTQGLEIALPPLSSPLSDICFITRLRSILTDNRFDRQRAGLKQGHLHLPSLWKVATGSVKLFSKKEMRQNKGYNIKILIDASGSMRDTFGSSSRAPRRIAVASKLALTLADDLLRAGANVSVSAFNCIYTPLIPFARGRLRIAKTDQYALRKTCEELSENHSLCSGNHDFDAIYTALQELEGQKQKNEKNILLVFSDGSPHCDRSGRRCYDQPFGWHKDLKKFYASLEDLQEHLNKTTDHSAQTTIPQLLRSYPETVSLGFGIDTPVVKDLYPEYAVVSDPNLFRPLVLEALNRHLKRG